MSRRILVIALVAVVAIAGAVSGYLLLSAPSGADTAEIAVSEYISALNEHDKGRLERIADPDYDSAAEIDSRLRKLDGRRLQVSRLVIANVGEAGTLKTAEIIGTVTGEPFSETIQVNLRDNGWFVALGVPKNPGVVRPTSGS